MSSFVPEPMQVQLGDMTYPVRPLKWKRLSKLNRELADLLKELDESLDLSRLLQEFLKPEGMPNLEIQRVSAALGVLQVHAAAVLTLAIPKVDIAIFSDDADEETSPDIEQVIEAFRVVFRVNHLDYVKNLFAGAGNTTRTQSLPTFVTSSDTPPPLS